MTAATVDTRGNVDRSAVTTEELNQTFGAALAAQPPKPVSFTLNFPTCGTSGNLIIRLLEEAIESDFYEPTGTKSCLTTGL